jgi:hypothetical protein
MKTGERTVKEVKSLLIKLPSGGLTNLCRLAVVACMAVTLAAGCHKNNNTSQSAAASSQEGIVPSDPQVATNLAILTAQVHRSLNQHQYRLTGSFEQFVEVSHVEAPPPPPGQKYAINKVWRVILVDANAK